MDKHATRRLTRRTALLTGVALALGSRTARATPRVGQRLPAFEVDDLTGRAHHSRELAGRYTFVLVGSDTDADSAMRRWGAAADRRLPPGAGRVTVLAFNLAFFIATATARSMARARTPESTWNTTWMERHGELAATLGLPESEVPFVFVLDPSGRIVAAAHCEVDAPPAEAIWAAFAP